jgi:hypothetical protein
MIRDINLGESAAGSPFGSLCSASGTQLGIRPDNRLDLRPQMRVFALQSMGEFHPALSDDCRDDLHQVQ